MSYKPLRLLAVDDDNLILQSLKMTLPSPWTMVGVNSMREIPNQFFDAAFVDMHLTGQLERAEGIDVVRHLSSQDPHLEIVAMSGDLDRNIMESCLRAGAGRFLSKPLNSEEVSLILGKIEALVLMRQATLRPTGQIRWIGASPSSDRIRKSLASLRGESGPILIEGESGTGKEVAARLLNQQESGRSLVSVNIASIPENLFESEIFGHVKGAFTGAEQNKMGLAEAAHGGDLFLDEIEVLSLSLQPKLLRFLESGEIRRVGAKENIKIQARVIAATNQNLEKLVREGKFREDLLWRLSGKKLHLPPLRERLEDLQDLAQYFLELEKPKRNKTFDPQALESLKQYSWPGNVRELRRLCEQLALLSPLPIIRKEDVLRSVQPNISANSSEGSVDLSLGLETLLLAYEKSILKKAVDLESDIERLCATLKISRSNLYKKIKDHDIELKKSAPPKS